MSSTPAALSEKRAMWMGIIGNAILFGAKIVIGTLFNSIAIVSDSFNSLTDIVASTIVLISVRTSHQAPDAGHPFGHKRAQPLAGLVVAILTGIVGFEIIAQSVTRLIDGSKIEQGLLPIILVAGVMVMKLGMHLYARFVGMRTGSTAILASAADHRNDVLVSAAVLVGVVASNLGVPVLDPIVAILIGLWIIRAGFSIGRTNLKYLMGEAPPRELVEQIKEKARGIEGVMALNDVFAHYVGTEVEIEVHIDVDRHMSIENAHAIGKQVQWAIEEMPEISHAFIHIDPFDVPHDEGRAPGTSVELG
jgi:cation diffusion facilitator family transporter